MGLFDRFRRKSVAAADPLTALMTPFRLLVAHTGEGVSDPYSQSIYFYAAIRKIALQFEGARWQVEGRTSKKPVAETDRLATLFARPNPLMSGADFRMLCVLYWTIYGGVQIIKMGPQGSRIQSANEVPWYLFPVPVTGWERIKPEPTSLLSFSGWRWGSNTFAPYEVISLVEHDPSMLSVALPVTRPLRLTFERTFSADQYYATLFKNGAVPSGILSTDQPLGPTQAQEILDAFEARHKGMANSGRPAIVHSGLKYQTTAMDLKSVNLPEDRKAALEEVCMATGVPKTILGITEDANRATAREQMAIFLEQTIIPRMQTFERALDEQLFQAAASAYRGRFVAEELPALKPTNSEQATTALQLKALGVPGTQIKAHLGLSYDIPDPVLPAAPADASAAPGAAESGATVAEVTYNGAQVTSALDILNGVTAGTLAPAAAIAALVEFLRIPEERARLMVEAQANAKPAEPPPAKPPAPPVEPAKSIVVVSAADALRRSRAMLSARKSARAARLESLRQQIVAATFDPTERALKPAIEEHFVKLRGVQLRRLNQFLRDGKIDAKSLEPSNWFHVAKGAEVVPDAEEIGRILFDSTAANADLYRRASQPIQDAILLVADHMASELPNGLLRFNVTHPAITDATKARLAEMVQINATVQADIRTSLLKTLDAMAGAPPTEIARQLREDVGGAFDRAYSRTLTIARTESGAVASDYRHAVIEVEGFQEHEWVPAGDELTREDHADFGAQGAIPLAQSFRAASGAEMLRPHEPGAPAEQVANCRCVEIAAGTLKSVSVPVGALA